MPFGGFVPPTGMGNITAPLTSMAKATPVKQVVDKKWETHIDKDIVEAIIAESNTQELKWLEEVLAGLKIRNPKTGRYLKSERYLEQIRRIYADGTSRGRTTPGGGPLQEIQSDGEQD